MTVEVLSSNVVNYLVWRYLQEAGYAHAAWHLSKRWHRDPQKLPFAPRVRHHALVEMLSDGLWYDQLQSIHGTHPRRHTFGPNHGDPFPAPLDAPEHDRDVESTRKTSRKRRRDASAPDKEPTTRQRRAAEARAGAVRAMDAMDVDAPDVTPPVANGAVSSAGPPFHPLQTQQQLDSESAPAVFEEAESPVPAVEEIIVPVPTTLSRGYSSAAQAQREREVRDLTRTTTFVPLSGLAGDVSSTGWTPGGESGEPALLVAGEQFIREYTVPASTWSIEPSPEEDERRTSAPPTPKTDIDMPLSPFHITSTIFISPTAAIVAADQEHVSSTNHNGAVSESPTGHPGMTVSKLYLLDRNLHRVRLLSSVLGTVLQLRWNRASRRLLCVATGTDEGSGCLCVFTFSDMPHASSSLGSVGATTNGVSDGPQVTTVKLASTPRAAFDAAWISPSRFLVTGPELLREYDVDEEEIRLQNVIDTPAAWEKMRHDDITGITALATATSADGLNQLGLLMPSDPPLSGSSMASVQATTSPTETSKSDRELHTHSTADHDICEIAFQPLSVSTGSSLFSSVDGPPRILASCSDAGYLALWDAIHPFTRLATIPTGTFPALALAWRPDGKALASGGLDEVRVWEIESDARREVRGTLRARWKWNADRDEKMVNGNMENGVQSHQQETAAGKSGEAQQTNGVLTVNERKALWNISPEAEQEFELPHDLTWNPSGRTIAFTVANQIALIGADM